MKTAIFSFVFMIFFVITSKNLGPEIQAVELIILAALGLYLGFKTNCLISIIKEHNK